MIIIKHELRQGRTAFIIWTAAIAALLMICVVLFPEMKGQMEGIGDVFASMGVFSSAFGMDRLNFGTLKGFYAIECGNVLGLGGAFYASLCAAGMLSKEEKDKTAEFLLTLPIKRSRVVTEKFLAVCMQIAGMNVIVYGASIAMMFIIGEKIPFVEVSLLHFAYWILQMELACICFGISAFLRKGSVGVGLGLAMLMYCLNLISNMTEKAEGFKYLTPFAYCEGADIITECRLDMKLIFIGLVLAGLSLILAYYKYEKKDIH